MLFLCALCLGLVVTPRSVSAGAAHAMQLCVTTIVPALFPFFVLSRLLMQSGFVTAAARRCGFLMRTLFALPDVTVFALLMGFTSGNPVGARCTAMLRDADVIDADQGTRLMILCNNASPLFCIGVIGVGLYSSMRIGVVMLATHILSAILIAIVLGMYADKRSYVRHQNLTHTSTALSLTDTVPLSQGLAVAVRESVALTALICGFIIFFGALTSMVQAVGITGAIEAALSLVGVPYSVSAALVSGALELTGGVADMAVAEVTIQWKCVLTALLLGFSGLSIVMQVYGITLGRGIDIKKYIVCKAIQGVLAALMCWVLL